MTPEIIKTLSEKEENQQLAALRQRLQGLVQMSRSVMKDYYSQWDLNDAVYRGERKQDVNDKDARKRNEPGKVFLPLTHSQVQTFVSFGTMLLTQRDYLYELDGSGLEDVKAAKLAQACLERDLNYNKFKGVLLPQFLTDVARYGLGVFKSQWRRETVPFAQQVPDPKYKPVEGLPVGTPPPMVTVYQPKTKYLGNMVEVISPYRWFPDTRLPLTRYRDGEFCADENEMSFIQLKKMQDAGDVAGVDNIPKLPDDTLRDRRLLMDATTNAAYSPILSPKDAAQFCVLTEVEFVGNPSKIEIAPGQVINKDLDADVIILFWIANDGRIIRVEDSGYEHNQFLHDAGQFFNDQSRLLNFGIAELLGPMQEIIDWLMNSRVTNVRKVIQNQLVVDPRYVDMQDLKDRNPIIRLKSTADGMAIDSYIKQLGVSDVTTGHITDMSLIKGFSEDATGMSENLLGQYAEGRRSAREASNVNANAASRVVLPMKGLWESAILPLGQKMLSNLRQGLDQEQLVSILGLQRFMMAAQDQSLQNFIPVDKSLLVGNYDFLPFDATLPSQRTAIASALQGAGEILIKSPAAIFALNKDPMLIFDEWLELMGVKNAERFNLTPQRFAALAGLAQAARNPGGAGASQQQGGNGPPNGGR